MTDKLSPKGESLVILLVEDNSGHAELIMRNFKAFRVTNRLVHVSDGELALDYLFQRGEYIDPVQNPLPHIILLDLRLPRIDGIEVLKTIKASEKLCKIPVVILTTSEDDQDVAKAYQNHVNSYLIKPADFDKFTELMKELGFYWLGWNYYPKLS